MEKEWYVYGLWEPDAEMPFYIGKGTGKRINQHEHGYPDGNAEKQNIIRKVQSQGKQVIKKKIAEFSDEREAYYYEREMINLYHEHLTNISPGGGRLRSLEKPTVQELKSSDAYHKLKDVANYFGVSMSTLYDYLKKMNIEPRNFPLNRHAFISQADFQRIKAAKERPWELDDTEHRAVVRKEPQS